EVIVANSMNSSAGVTRPALRYRRMTRDWHTDAHCPTYLYPYGCLEPCIRLQSGRHRIMTRPGGRPGSSAEAERVDGLAVPPRGARRGERGAVVLEVPGRGHVARRVLVPAQRAAADVARQDLVVGVVEPAGHRDHRGRALDHGPARDVKGPAGHHLVAGRQEPEAHVPGPAGRKAAGIGGPRPGQRAVPGDRSLEVPDVAGVVGRGEM